MFGHHPHSLGYLCAKFRFFRGVHCWASRQRKIAYWLTQSLNYSRSLLDAPATEAIALEHEFWGTKFTLYMTRAYLMQRDHATACAVPMSEKFTVQLCALYFRHDVIRLSWQCASSALNASVKKFKKAQVNGGSNYDSIEDSQKSLSEQPILDLAVTYTLHLQLVGKPCSIFYSP